MKATTVLAVAALLLCALSVADARRPPPKARVKSPPPAPAQPRKWCIVVGWGLFLR